MRVIGLLVLSLLMSCGENRVDRCKEQAIRDIQAVLNAWDKEDIDGLLRHVRAAHYLDDMHQAALQLRDLRHGVGAVTQRSGIIIDPRPDDPRAYAVAREIFTLEQGAGMLALVYDHELKIVGFQIEAQPLR